ncbi:MAG: glutaredoxin domain-containing protein [Rhabdochlamydiaceae bacterium]
MKKLLFILPLILTSFSYLQGEEAPKNISTETATTNKETLLYYIPNCPYCHEVIDYLKSINKKIPMIDLNGNLPAQDDLKKVGGDVHVPCLIVEGKAIYGAQDAIKWLETHKDQLPNVE